MANNANTAFPSHLYKCFRPFADANGLEALDTHCDLRSDGGRGCPIELGALNVPEGNATNPLAPLVGLKTQRAVDLLRVTLETITPLDSQAAPPTFNFGVVLGQAGAGTTLQFSALATLNTFEEHGLMVQLTGLSFDTAQFWAGVVRNEGPPVVGGRVRLVLRAFVYRAGLVFGTNGVTKGSWFP